MKVSKPIIIVGAERSGKTLLFSILANHPRLYWLSNLDSLWPTGTIPITLARRILSLRKVDHSYIAVPGTRSRVRGRFPPSECTAYWKRVFGWGDEENYLIEDDCADEGNLTTGLGKSLIHDLGLRIFLSGKERLLVEQAGFSLKIPFFNALFPDAIFLHVIRNPFENHDSIVRVKLASDQKLWGVKIPGWRQLVDADPSTQAALQLESVLRIIDEDIVKIQDSETRFMRIRYEHLVSTPQATIQSVLDFCHLDMAPQVLAGLSGVRNITNDDRGAGYISSQETSEVLTSLAQKYSYSAPQNSIH